MPDASRDAFLAARDLLLRHRADLDAAWRELRWPVLERFNWALDHFDRLAVGNGAPALRFIGPENADRSIGFAEMARRPNQVANHLRGLSVRRGTASCCWATCRRFGKRCWRP